MKGFLFLLLLLSTSNAAKTTKPTVTVLGSNQVFFLDPSVQHIPLAPYDSTLRPPPSKIPSTFEIHIGSSVFRDGLRCGKTIFTALKRAVHPERLRFGIIEQLVEGDPTCLEEYCKLALEEWPDYPDCRYKDVIKVNPRPAAEASGCTTARHKQQKMIGDEEFCLQVDGHSIFTNNWDQVMLDEWKRIDNEMAIISVYPHDLHDFIKENGDNNAPDWLPHLCTTVKGGHGLTRIVGASIKHNAAFPQLSALWGGGLSFSKCHAERNVPVDPHTPWLWDGEEFLRSADYWTHGYDIYSPSRIGNVLYHNYSKKPASFWNSPIDRAVKALETEMTSNRFRLRVGLGFKGPVNALELDKYKFGTARSFQQYLKFANVTLEGMMNQTHSCAQLHWVPYSNATEVEEIVQNGWKMLPTLDSENINAPVKKVVRKNEEMNEEHVEDEVVRHGISAHVENGADTGDDKPAMSQLRQRLQNRMKQSSNLPAWGLLLVVVIALFVTLSSDKKSWALRRFFVSRAPHLSHD